MYHQIHSWNSFIEYLIVCIITLRVTKCLYYNPTKIYLLAVVPPEYPENEPASWMESILKFVYTVCI